MFQFYSIASMIHIFLSNFLKNRTRSDRISYHDSYCSYPRKCTYYLCSLLFLVLSPIFTQVPYVISQSDSNSSSSESDDGAVLGGEPKRPRVLDVLAEATSKRTKFDSVVDVSPSGFLDALPLAKALSSTSAVMRLLPPSVEEASQPLTGVRASGQSSKQFWKARDNEEHRPRAMIEHEYK